MTAGPLARYTVLDLTRVRAGPTAVRYFADWGANVIKVEMPPSAGEMDMGGPRHGPDFQNLHRNKRSITLNLKEPEGKAIFMKLVEKADVVVENYRADVKFRLGIDYESLKKVNPRIILGSISGFGQDGPYAERPASTRSPRAWAASCGSPDNQAGARYAPASPSPTWARGCTAPSAA